MGKILVPGESTKPQKIKTVIIFQDENYTIMRNKETVTPAEILDVPLHLFLLALSMLSPVAYVPKIGKKAYIGTMEKLKKQFKDSYHQYRKDAERIRKQVDESTE